MDQLENLDMQEMQVRQDQREMLVDLEFKVYLAILEIKE